MPMMNVRMPDELLDEFKQHCESSATTQSDVVRALVSRYMNAPPDGLHGPVSAPAEFEPNENGGALSSIRVNFTVSELAQIDIRRHDYGLTKSGYITQATRSMLLNAPMLSAEQVAAIRESLAEMVKIGAAVNHLAVHIPAIADITPAQVDALIGVPKMIEQQNRCIKSLLDSVASRNLLQ